MKLENELDHLKQMIIKMSEIVLDNLKNAIDLYHNYDETKASLINDDVVDLHERLIEEMSLDIMVKERPYARDLRMVSGILKLVEDLERIGDHAEDLKNLAFKLNNIEHHECLLLNESVEKAFKMVEDSVKAFVDGNIALADDVIKRDDIIDDLYNKSIERIIKHLEDKDYSNSFAVYTTLVVKYIERIADHAVNIAEWIIYIELGYHKNTKIF